MEKSYKVSSIVMSILALVSIAIFITSFSLFYRDDLANALYYPFKNMVDFSTGPVDVFVCLIASYVVALLGIAFLLLTIFLVKGKRKVLGIITCSLLTIIAPFGTVGYLFNFWRLIFGYDGNFGIFYFFTNNLPDYGIYSLLMVIFFILAIVFTIIAYAESSIYTKECVLEEAGVQGFGELPLIQEGAIPNPVPVVSETVVNDSAPDFVAEPEPSTGDSGENKNDSNKIDYDAIAVMIRDIVRDEISRSLATRPQPTNDQHAGNSSVVGATFGGPLIVQYFNGAAPVSTVNKLAENNGLIEARDIEETPVEEENKEASTEETTLEENLPEETSSIEPNPVEETPAEEENIPVVTDVVSNVIEVTEPVVASEKKPIIRIPFQTRMINAEKEMQDNYNELKNDILSYGVKSRVSNSGDTFRLHCKTYIKLTIAGKSLKLYFALNPNDYADSTIPVQDASDKSIYAEIPLVFKVKSPLSLRRCKDLIADVMERDDLEQGEIGITNWVKELEASNFAVEEDAISIDEED